MSRLLKNAALALAATGLALAGAAGTAVADATAEGVAVGSPGVLSGNVVQVPIHAQLNLCGNSVNIIGLVNPAAGNLCIND
ncbi:chaplin [Streptomyces sp. WAC06614]|uniref:chaplin n=1 Tax=Streptomyces sp. WAC06614 TaxID=2487416 RepID=UPI000F7B0C80|nr:chaplin [Streptomyces sp. WAC06614]RSS78917.1 chaplin [Streptomyces sp. WAC06614]